MKITKLSLLALSFGLFAASCGETNEEANDNDTMINNTTIVEPTTMAPDTMIAAPAGDTMTTTTTTTTDTVKVK